MKKSLPLFPNENAMSCFLIIESQMRKKPKTNYFVFCKKDGVTPFRATMILQFRLLPVKSKSREKAYRKISGDKE
jgi:hypothetical protein